MLTSLKEELATRVHKACVPTRATEMTIGPYTTHFKQVSSLIELDKSALLRQCLPKCAEGATKIYALVGDVHKLPRETQGKTADCTCHIPWNQRSLWDRRGFVQYKLPAATSLWQSQSLRLSGSMPECVAGEEVHETVWVERGAPVDKPVVMFTVGTMRNSRHAMCELSRCWSQCLLEYAEQFWSHQ